MRAAPALARGFRGLRTAGSMRIDQVKLATKALDSELGVQRRLKAMLPTTSTPPRLCIVALPVPLAITVRSSLLLRMEAGEPRQSIRRLQTPIL